MKIKSYASEAGFVLQRSKNSGIVLSATTMELLSPLQDNPQYDMTYIINDLTLEPIAHTIFCRQRFADENIKVYR